ncbi:type IV pilus secretin PilQ [Chromobacterium violaceum]|uniref:Type IV pilus biogenesis and competence protein PilQ n=1 Tax=Chromobacterium violaceum TaxID=536 RepID=A0AAX2MH92_CHRVL|nr:type IV pilus secretin PilQ [Chromobacterium violaceum]OLZ87545.1 secretin [Chromobacterium violaceum]STB69296.1 Type IV pilus biogenesis and competence protein pilQ precursor [Chromobacterium violaceum]SUY93441.1 Type IV pilus biogenesis and competence protein pilQ precursor [Chromobacterium violaceum]
MKRLGIVLWTGLALCLSGGLAAAAPAITALDAGKVDGNRQTLQITFDGPAVKPNSFALSNPPRIALDFANTGVKMAKPSLNVDSPLLRSAVAVEASGRSRLVLSLARNASYRSEISGNRLLLTLDGSMSSEQGATPQELVPTSRADAQAQIAAKGAAGLDFRRGRNGEGRVELALPNANTPVDIRRDGANLVVDIAGASLPPQLVRRIDVTDFGTPVAKVDAANLGGNIRVTVIPQGDWEYSSYQTDGKLVVEVRRPALETAGAAAGKPQYKGDKLSLNFQNIEVRTVLQVIAEFTGLNVVTSDSVTGNITLRLKDVPWDQALDLILQSKGLDQRRNGNIIQIAPRDELLARDKQVQEARQQLATLEPLRSETFVLRYRSAEDFKKVLDGDNNSGKKESLLSERGSVLIDPKTNTLIVNDIGTAIDKVRDVIAKTDIPVKQVLIEARIVEATDNWERDLGIKLTYDRMDPKGIISGNPLGTNVNNVTNLNTNQPYVIQTTPAGVNLPIATPYGTLSALYNVGHSVILGLELQAMQAEDKGRIISSPRVMATDRQEATIEQGTEIPYQEASSSGATSVSFKKAVLRLNVKPQITPDNHVIMDITVNKDSANFEKTVNGTPSLSTEKIITQVLVENGGTVVLGGIYQQQLNDVINKVPFLGDIPLLGALFRSSQKIDKRSELLIFITPKVINDLVAESR